MDKRVMKRQNLSSSASIVEFCKNRQVLAARTIEFCKNLLIFSHFYNNILSFLRHYFAAHPTTLFSVVTRFD